MCDDFFLKSLSVGSTTELIISFFNLIYEANFGASSFFLLTISTFLEFKLTIGPFFVAISFSHSVD